MVQGLRIADAPRIQQLLQGDQRLLLRIGSLLQQHCAVSEMLLQSLQDIAGLRDLLMDRRLANSSGAELDALICEHCGADSGLCCQLAEDDWRVLVCEDELDNPLLQEVQTPDHSYAVAENGLDALRSRMPEAVQPALRALAAARSDEQRAAAVEQLRYVTVPQELLEALMPLFLADGAAAVRDAARRLLAHVGVRPVVLQLLEALCEGQQRIIESLCADLAELPQTQAELVIAALEGAFEQGLAASALIRVGEALAPVLAHSRRLQRFLELALAGSEQLSLLGLVRQLQQANSEAVAEALQSLYGRGSETDARLISLLVAPGTALASNMLQRALDLLLDPSRDLGDRMALAAALARVADQQAAVAALVDRAAELARVRDSAVLWLIGEWARQGRFDAVQSEALLPSLLSLYEEGSGPQISTLLEARLPASLPLPAGKSGAVILLLGELAARNRAPRSLDLIEGILQALAPGQDAACWRLIEEAAQAIPRRLGLQILPKALAEADDNLRMAAINRLLKCLRRDPGHGSQSVEERCAEQGLLVLTAARLLESCTDGSLCQAIDAAAGSLRAHGWQALGLLAAGPHCSVERRSAIINELLDHCLGQVSDQGTRQLQSPREDNPIFIFDHSLAQHTHFVPELLQALEGIARSAHTPPPLLRYVIDRLSAQLLDIAAWRVVWAPGNILLLAGLLARLAAQADFPPPLRRRVAEALESRASQPEMLGHLARVLAADSGGELSAHAARSAQQMISRHAEDRYLDDERQELARAAVAYLAIADFADDDLLIRQRIANMLSSLRRSVQAPLRQELRQILTKNPPAVQERLRWLDE